MVLLLVLYIVSARPIRTESQWRIVPPFAQRIYELAAVQRVSGALHSALSRLATKYLALTVHSDPYASNAFAKPTHVYDSFKILVSFSQVRAASALSQSVPRSSPER